MSAEKLLYSPEGTGEVLDLSRAQVYELLARGEIESFKIGRLRKVPREAIDAYIERQRAAAGTQTAGSR